MIGVDFQLLPSWMFTSVDPINLTWSIPDQDEISAVHNWLSLLNEIEKQREVDLQRHKDIFAASVFEMPRDFQLRDIWRIGSYVVFACTLDACLRDLFRRLVEIHLKVIGNPSRTSAPAPIEAIRLWRNKVFGHSAWHEREKQRKGKPIENSTTLTTSLTMLSIRGMTPRGVRLGAATYGLEGEQPSHPFEAIDFDELMKRPSGIT